MDNAICANCGKTKKPWFALCWECTDKENNKQTYLSSTALGKEFNVSNQRINLIFSELGWIEKDNSGWKVTKQGKTVGGRQLESDSAISYVKFPESILTNKTLLESFNVSPKQNADKQIAVVETAAKPAYNSPERLIDKYPAKHKALDGHFVRSRAEQLIDNFLYVSQIVHAYERKLQTEEGDYYCDFYIPAGGGRPHAVWIEYWGLEQDPKYVERKNKKKQIYKENDWALIELNDADIENLEEVLTKELRRNKIKVD